MTAQTSHAQHPTTSQRTALVALSAAYIGNALMGGHVAMRDSLPEAPFGIRSSRSVRSEFYAGTGTGLSPGLPMLAIHAAVAGLTYGSATTSRRATQALAIGGGLYFIGQLSEPITYRIARHPTAWPQRTLIVAANIVLPAALTAVAIDALR